MFAPIAKWAARIDNARRIPEYVARAYATAMNGRPGPVVLALPEDMLLDVVETVDRPRVERVTQQVGHWEVDAARRLLVAATRPIAIIGGAYWSEGTATAVEEMGINSGIPLIAAFRRQDAVGNALDVYAGNLGYGPNPMLAERVKAADVVLVLGARLGEATTDGYMLVTPEHSRQRLIHVHPDPEELNSAYRADLAICSDVMTFADRLGSELMDGPAREEGAEAHVDYLNWSTPTRRESVDMDLGPCVATMRDKLPTDTIICNGAGNFSGWWHRYWRYGGPGCQLAPTAGAMGYGVPAAVAAALRHPERCVVALAGDGDFLMNGQELATAVQYGVSMLVLVIDNGAYGTIRMHQEREFPGRVAGTGLRNPDFAALARAYGCWAETVERTSEFAPALNRAMAERGVRLLHIKTDVEAITAGTTLSAIRAR